MDRSLHIHHGGKNGDLIYALPVVKALARKHGPITLVTSVLCYQLVPLLWEQPYIKDVEMLYGEARITKGVVEPWAVLSPEEGINLSLQPAMYRPDAPVSWTMCYAEIAGIKELTLSDKIALPTLWNHRQWYYEHEVKYDGKEPWRPPETVVLAPESETLKCIALKYWRDVAEGFQGYSVMVIGQNTEGVKWPKNVTDLRGMTTVSSAARLMCEARLFIGAMSLPFNLARHAGTPSFVFQEQYLERCIPVDTPYRYYSLANLSKMIADGIVIIKTGLTTLWNQSDLKLVAEAA